MNHFVFFLLCLGLSTTSYSQDNSTKEISGTITYLNNPLKDVNIIIKGTSKGTKTNEQGKYSIQANVGDILEYSHVSYTTVAVMIEDVTSTLNIELQEKDNKLDEVVVKAKIERDDAFKYNNKKGGPIMTAVGIVNPENFSGRLMYFDKRDFLYRYDSFSEFYRNL